jgi:hypothetical protein
MKTDESKAAEAKLFRHQFLRVFPKVANEMTQEFPTLLCEGRSASNGPLSLQIELTEPLRIVVNQFNSVEADLVDSLHYFPYFDQSGVLRFVENIDEAGFSSPDALAEHCLRWLTRRA